MMYFANTQFCMKIYIWNVQNAIVHFVENGCRHLLTQPIHLDAKTQTHIADNRRLNLKFSFFSSNIVCLSQFLHFYWNALRWNWTFFFDHVFWYSKVHKITETLRNNHVLKLEIQMIESWKWVANVSHHFIFNSRLMNWTLLHFTLKWILELKVNDNQMTDWQLVGRENSNIM